VIGISAARNKKAESIIIPLLDVFQSIPILGFFPLVILGVVGLFPREPFIGVNLAVIILIFTSMSWNIAFGVYEAVKSIPQDYVDLTQISESSTWNRITSLYIPASLSRIAYNVQTSWAVGLFYLISSEILSLGKANYQVQYGIGIAIVEFATKHEWTNYAYAIMALVIAVIIWQFVFLREFSLWSERYKFVEEPRGEQRDPLLKFYSWVNHRSISKLFLYTHGRGVTRFTSSLSLFRKGWKYVIAILVGLFIVLDFGAFVSIPSHLSHIPSFSLIASDEAQVALALGFSFVRVWYVYFLCILVGVPLGISVALNTKMYTAAVPVLEVVASIPAPALLPVLVAILHEESEAVAAVIIFLGMFWYVIFNVMAGIRTLPAELFELKRGFQISTLKAWRNIYLPSVFTAFVTGSITAIGAGWNTLIVAEYFQVSGQPPETQVSYGIGKVIAIATNTGNFLMLTLAILSMTTLIVVFNLTVWRRVYHYTTKKYAYNR
jgi:NitT/TauT family transport system permease protein